MNWAKRHRLWHVLGVLVVLVAVAVLAFCESRPLDGGPDEGAATSPKPEGTR